jgi:hypothetical protein
MKCYWQPFLYCGLWGTFWCTCSGLLFQVWGVRRHACYVLPRVQYVCVMCVIQCCSLLLVQPLDIPSAALMSHRLIPPQHWSEKTALLAVQGPTQKFPKFLVCGLTTCQISVRLHSLWSNPLLHWYSDPSRISMISSIAESHFASASSSQPVPF